MKVSLFVTCLADQLYPEVALASARVLERLGCTVEFLPAQVCCGQPAYNAGYPAEARRVARALLECFDASDYVVTPSGSCAAMIRHHFEKLFSSDQELEAQAARLAAKTCEFSQFVVNELGATDVGAVFPHRVTYHPSCHALRLLGVTDEPLRLIRAIRGIEFVELPRAEDCCGFGGLFSLKLSRISSAIASEKSDHVAETSADYLVGTDMGCLMNIEGTLGDRGSPVKTLHLAELLDRALSESRDP